MSIGLPIAALVVTAALRCLMVDRSVKHGLSRLDVRNDRVLRIEVFEQDHCCGGSTNKLITIPHDMHSTVLSALRQIDRSTLDGGCKCGTSGTQIVIYMRGEPAIAQISFTGCGDFVLHDGKGQILAYFKSKALHGWLQDHYWDITKTKDPEPGDTPNTHSPSAPGVGGR